MGYFGWWPFNSPMRAMERAARNAEREARQTAQDVRDEHRAEKRARAGLRPNPATPWPQRTGPAADYLADDGQRSPFAPGKVTPISEAGMRALAPMHGKPLRRGQGGTPGETVYFDDYADVRREMWDRIKKDFGMPTNKVRRPMIGENVLVRLLPQEQQQAPYAAIVCYVDPDGAHINAAVFDYAGSFVGGCVRLVYAQDAGLTSSWAYCKERS